MNILIWIQLTMTFCSDGVCAFSVTRTILTRKLSFQILICIHSTFLTRNLSFFILICSQRTLQTLRLSYSKQWSMLSHNYSLSGRITSRFKMIDLCTFLIKQLTSGPILPSEIMIYAKFNLHYQGMLLHKIQLVWPIGVLKRGF